MNEKWDGWNKYPLVQQFITGAMQANSAPHGFIHSRKPSDSQMEKLEQAEKELHDMLTLMVGFSLRSLYAMAFSIGALADSGYTMYGQTRQELDLNPDDEQHKLLAFDILAEEY